MKDFNELKNVVRQKGFGSSLYGNVNGEPVYLSRGIREIFMDCEEDTQKVIDVVRLFQKGDYGNAAEHGKEQRSGHEYGRYNICTLESEASDTGVWVHRAEKTLLVYFKFER